jgi:hypothetical protein
MQKSFETEVKHILRRYNSGEHLERRELLVRELNSRPVILYGVGYFKQAIFNNLLFENVRPICFCDSFHNGIDIDTGLPIIDTAQLPNLHLQSNIVITVVSERTSQIIESHLIDLGFDKKQIFTFKHIYPLFRQSATIQSRLTASEFNAFIDGYSWVYEQLEDNRSREVLIEKIASYLLNDTTTSDSTDQFLMEPTILLNREEVLLDGGVGTGNATRRFVDNSRNSCKFIYGFDIDQANIREAQKNLERVENKRIENIALWSESSEVNAHLLGNLGSYLDSNGEQIVSATSIDEYFSNSMYTHYPSFIRLDIEGSEEKALIGATRLINHTRPILAVCSYYRPDSIYNVLRIILSFDKSYKICLRHYSNYLTDSVIYAC